MNISAMEYPEKVLTSLLIVIIMLGTCFDFFDIAQGTGNWIGEIALTWADLFIARSVFSLFVVLVFLAGLWNDRRYAAIIGKLISVREMIGSWPWLFAFIILILILPFQFSMLGIVFQGIFIRLLIWSIGLFLFAFLINEKSVLIGRGIF